MKIIKDDGHDIWIELPCKTISVISKVDEWIFNKFNCFGITGSASRYVFAERPIKTEYSTIRERVYLHRLIVKPLGKEQVDHIDRDKLNNRRSNLRICTRSQNGANVGPRKGRKYIGVYFDKTRFLNNPFSAWISYIDAKDRGQEKRKYLGHFRTEIEAAIARDNAAIAIHGEFAYLNIPDKLLLEEKK
jgi:hypothetical protein